VVIGHPFNPPHIIPLVEVVGGSKTSPDAIQQAINFYASIGKKPIHLKKELPGQVANRFQAALYREMLYLVLLDQPITPQRAGLDPKLFAGHSLRSGFLTSAAARGASIFKMADQSRHKSMDTLRGYVRDAEIFKHHAGEGLL
jgi:3-hydroxyacyl-CoA dehydrogenase